MNKQNEKQLEKMGGRVTTVAEFLDLSHDEELLVETGLALSNLVREMRVERGLTQTQLAARLGTKQPNIARLEQAAGTSFDALFQALYALGVTPFQIADTLAKVALPEKAAA